MVSYHLCGGSFYQETQFISCYDPFMNPTVMAFCHFALKGPYCDDETGVIQAPHRSFISQTQSDGVIGALPAVNMEARSLRVLRWACGQEAQDA